MGGLPTSWWFDCNAHRQQQTIEAWRVIFGVTIVLYAVEIVVYTWLGSGEEQPWHRTMVGADGGEGERLVDSTTGEQTPLNGGAANGESSRKLDSYTG